MPKNPSKRFDQLMPYVFSTQDVKKLRLRAEGKRIIDLGMGSPDLPTPRHIVEALVEAVSNRKETHRYPNSKGLPQLRESIAQWYKRRFNVNLDPEGEVFPLVGSKEGIAHLALAYIDSGDFTITLNPTYPAHYNGTLIAGGRVFFLPLREGNDFTPDLTEIPTSILNKTKLMIVSFPHNPTTSTVDVEFYKNVLELAEKYDFIVVSDLAYSEICFDGYKAPSLLEVDGAKERAVEFNTFSKTFNMAGWRTGYVVGNRDVISKLAQIKSYIDYGIFEAIQYACISALNGPLDDIRRTVETYSRRRDLFISTLNGYGVYPRVPKATMYVWLRIPPGYTSLSFSDKLLDEKSIVVSPGDSFGKHGEGFIRVALVADEELISEAGNAIGSMYLQ
ncbi:MAG: aminotransferase class I/II-fold pyridoxal phosphate-dependent enzyme [Dictyoglomi bacterium]|jgi:LL-diaminopimelate aminotransferase|nr:aminotransferase class I/II-fold pyridoxal phosphate-dependent enzyme [Dictyoglomota bacterium]